MFAASGLKRLLVLSGACILFSACQPEPVQGAIDKLGELEQCLERNKQNPDELFVQLEAFSKENAGFFKESGILSKRYSEKRLKRLSEVKKEEVLALLGRLNDVNSEIMDRLDNDTERLSRYGELMGSLK